MLVTLLFTPAVANNATIAAASGAGTAAGAAAGAGAGAGVAISGTSVAGALNGPTVSALSDIGPAAKVVMSAAPPPETVFSWGGYFQAIAVMLLLLGLLWLALWLIRRSGKFAFLPKPGAWQRDALTLEAQLPLGPRKNLMVVRFLNRRILLGVTEQSITFLKEVGIHDHDNDADSSAPQVPRKSKQVKHDSPLCDADIDAFERAFDREINETPSSTLSDRASDR